MPGNSVITQEDELVFVGGMPSIIPGNITRIFLPRNRVASFSAQPVPLIRKILFEIYSLVSMFGPMDEIKFVIKGKTYTFVLVKNPMLGDTDHGATYRM